MFLVTFLCIENYLLAHIQEIFELNCAKILDEVHVPFRYLRVVWHNLN